MNKETGQRGTPWELSTQILLHEVAAWTWANNLTFLRVHISTVGFYMGFYVRICDI